MEETWESWGQFRLCWKMHSHMRSCAGVYGASCACSFHSEMVFLRYLTFILMWLPSFVVSGCFYLPSQRLPSYRFHSYQKNWATKYFSFCTERKNRLCPRFAAFLFIVVFSVVFWKSFSATLSATIFSMVVFMSFNQASLGNKGTQFTVNARKSLICFLIPTQINDWCPILWTRIVTLNKKVLKDQQRCEKYLLEFVWKN